MDDTVPGILQARILEWVAFPFSRGSFQPRDRTQVSCIAGRFFTIWATREAQLQESWVLSAEFEAPALWPPDAKNWLIGKDPDARKDWRQEEKGVTEDETVGWHHWLNGHEFAQTLGDSEGQGSPWCPKESDRTEWLNNNNRLCWVTPQGPSVSGSRLERDLGMRSRFCVSADSG